MKRQVASGLFSADGLCLAALLLVLATFQVNCANDNFESGKDQRPKGYYGLLKDLCEYSKLLQLPQIKDLDQLV